jgi:hypothetical protein
MRHSLAENSIYAEIFCAKYPSVTYRTIKKALSLFVRRPLMV